MISIKTKKLYITISTNFSNRVNLFFTCKIELLESKNKTIFSKS